MFQKIVGGCKNAVSKVGTALIIATGTVVGAAHAALPTSVATTVAAIEANAQSMFDLVFPVVATIVGLSIVIKLFKRFANKA